METLVNYHSQITLTIFITLVISALILERIITFKPSLHTAKHFYQNVSLSIFNTIIVRIFLPFNLVFICIFTQEKGIGLFNFFAIPSYLEIILSLLIFDLILYWQHRLMHNVPILWKLHGVHHSDQLIDVSTGVRFHILEILLSFSVKITSVVLLGLSPVSVIIFEILLSSFSLFVHSNILLPKKINSILKKLIITPETHRIHHTILEANLASHGSPKPINEASTHETSKTQKYLSYNYSTSLHIWDFIFKSYLGSYTEKKEQAFGRLKSGEIVVSNSLFSMLKEPFQANK